MKNNKSSEKGQALVIIAFAIIGLLALTALAIDGGNVYSDRRNAQNAADTAVLATALRMIRNPGDWNDATTSGLTRAAENGYNNNTTTNIVEIHTPPITGPYSDCTSIDFDCNEYVQVIITSYVDTYFAPIVGINQLTNKVNAVARVQPTFIEPFLDGNAIVSCSQHECPAATVGGNSSTTLEGGGLFVNSDCVGDPQDTAFVVNGGGGLKSPSLCSVGKYENSNLNIGTINNSCEQVDCNTAFTEPNIPCSGNAEVDKNDKSILHPGTFTGNKFPPNGIKTLVSGTYCITSGDFDFPNGTLSGIGVIIQVFKGEVRINGGTVHLEAPSSGDYTGLLLYLPKTNHSPITINGNTTMSYKGMILAQSSHVLIDGTEAQDGFMSSQIISNTIDITGGSSTIIRYDSDDTWDPSVPPQIEFIE